jgi:hypothetical protein
MKIAGIGILLLLCAGLLGAQAAYIREVSGAVEVKAPGSAEWKAAEAGQALEKESLISTGFKSTALIMIGNSAVTVRPLTRLSIEEIAASQTGEWVVLNLRVGRVRADVKPPVGKTTDFSVRSPVATASVRGTVFDFDGLEATVEEGRVHLGGETVTGTYIGTGHTVAVNTETGKTAGVIESVKEELVPPLPAGVDSAEMGADAPVVPTGGNLGVDFDWGG